MSARLVPAIRQKIIETKNLLDRARENGEDMSEVLHVAKTLLVNQNVEFGQQSLSGLLSLAADCAKTLEDGRQSENDQRMTFESLHGWVREAAIVVESMHLSHQD